jgi:hypothetical protein
LKGNGLVGAWNYVARKWQQHLYLITIFSSPRHNLLSFRLRQWWQLGHFAFQDFCGGHNLQSWESTMRGLAHESRASLAEIRECRRREIG